MMVVVDVSRRRSTCRKVLWTALAALLAQGLARSHDNGQSRD